MPRRKAKRKYNKQWEKVNVWLDYSEEDQGAFCRICKTWSRTYGQKAKGVWITTPFNTWKNALEKMKIHAQSDQHKDVCQTEMAGSEAQVQGTIIRQLQQIGCEGEEQDDHKDTNSLYTLSCTPPHPSHYCL